MMRKNPIPVFLALALFWGLCGAAEILAAALLTLL